MRKNYGINDAIKVTLFDVINDPAVQSLLDLRKGSKASRLKSLKQKKYAVTGEGSSAAHTKYYDTSDRESDATRYSSCSDTSEEGFGVFMYNKSTETPKSTYFSLTITSSSLDFIHNLLDETLVNELTYLISNPVYTDAHTTSLVHNLEGNPEVRSFLSEMFLDDAAHHLSSPSATITHKLPINPQPNSLQAKAKKMMQMAKKNMRKINFKKAVTEKFREYDQKLEALTNFNKEELTIPDLEGAGLEKLKQQYKNDVDLKYHVDQLKAAMLSEANWKSDEDDASKPRSFEIHMSKNTKPRPSFYNNNFYYLVSLSTKEKYTSSITKQYTSRYYKQGIKDMISNRWCKETHRYHFEALNVRRSDDQECEFSYADLPRLSLNDVEDMYLLQVQDKLHHLPLEFVKDFNNALLLFIRRVVIQNRKLCDGSLEKIRENLIDMVIKNKLGKGNKRFKGRDWTDNNVVKSNEMVKKIDQTLKRQRAA
ncbi:hypothetical protein Tco_0401329 [Tanacetum coccineum]